MIVSQAQLDLILNRAMRSRVIHLPVRYGRFGERKRCPARAGGVYRLRASLPELYARHKHEANAQPTRARAVLSLFDLCHQPVPSVQITVSDVALNGDTWVVQFAKGEHREEPRLLAARPGMAKADYVSVPSQALVGAAEEVPRPYQAKLALEASDGLRTARNGQWDEMRSRTLKAIQTLRIEAARQNAGSQVARQRLRSIERQLKALEREARVPRAV